MHNTNTSHHHCITCHNISCLLFGWFRKKSSHCKYMHDMTVLRRFCCHQNRNHCGIALFVKWAWWWSNTVLFHTVPLCVTVWYGRPRWSITVLDYTVRLCSIRLLVCMQQCSMVLFLLHFAPYFLLSYCVLFTITVMLCVCSLYCIV